MVINHFASHRSMTSRECFLHKNFETSENLESGVEEPLDLLGKVSQKYDPQVKRKKLLKQIQEYEIVHLIWLWLKDWLALVFQASLLGGQSF